MNPRDPRPTFEDFVAARGEALLRFALLLCGDAHRGEDIVQSALFRAYRRWRRVAAMERPEAYVKRVIVNEHLRWRVRRSSAEVVTAGLPDAPTDEADLAARTAQRDAVWALLARLPRRQRAVLVLRYYEDLADAQIAAVLGCSSSAVRSNASRALATLRAVPELDREALR